MLCTHITVLKVWNTQTDIRLSKYKMAYIQESAGVKYATVYVGRSSIDEVYAREYITVYIQVSHIQFCVYFFINNK